MQRSNLDTLRVHDLKFSGRGDCKCMNEEVCRLIVRGLHHRRRCRDNRNTAALTDPVDVAVTMHDDYTSPQPAQSADEPASIDKRRAYALRQRLGAFRILDNMMMQ